MSLTRVVDERMLISIRHAASWAARQLLITGVARVRLAPGDATLYNLLVVGPGPELSEGLQVPGRDYWVCWMGSVGAGYPWAGIPVDGGYAAEKWVRAGIGEGTARWSGEVIAAFLTELSRLMKP